MSIPTSVSVLVLALARAEPQCADFFYTTDNPPAPVARQYAFARSLDHLGHFPSSLPIRSSRLLHSLSLQSIWSYAQGFTEQWRDRCRCVWISLVAIAIVPLTFLHRPPVLSCTVSASLQLYLIYRERYPPLQYWGGKKKTTRGLRFYGLPVPIAVFPIRGTSRTADRDPAPFRPTWLSPDSPIRSWLSRADTVPLETWRASFAPAGFTTA